MTTVVDRITKIKNFYSWGARTANGDLVHDLDELMAAVKRDAREEFFCHYPKDRIVFLQRMQVEWATVFASFPSAKREIEEGIDCYALGHNAACVFHMSRVGEIGLRTIGRELGVKAVRGGKVQIEWATWGDVFKAIEPTIASIRQKSNGAQKTNALTFYERILSDLRAIQSLYRDQTMHLREQYDDGEAQSAMFRVRELMGVLASKLDENSTRAIPWGAWRK